MDDQHNSLRRAIGLPLLVLYGLGTTIGAGIYVLIGTTAARAGIYAPISFLVAAFVMAMTAASFAELSGRFPVSAGEAAYVRAGFNSRTLSVLVGILVILAGAVSSSAISQGSAGYIREFIDVPAMVLIPIIVAAMGAVAAWGIVQTLATAAVFTLIEVGGLLLIVGGAFYAEPGLALRIGEVMPPIADLSVWPGIVAAGLLAFYAFIGFEDMVNVAEEVHEPKKTMPRAILLTLVISTALYFLIASIAVLVTPISGLAAAEAPLAFVSAHVAGPSPLVISFIGIIATLNGAIIQILMASRVLYGLANQGSVPAVFGRVNATTRTPLIATVVVTALIMILAMMFPLAGLAEMTSRITLIIFAVVNLALLRLKLSGELPSDGVYVVHPLVPAAGAFLCIGFLVAGSWFQP